jgi:hypothetical protein
MPDLTLRDWQEPSALLPLRWGSYRFRYLAGLGLAIGGGLLVQVTSAYTLPALPIGLFLHILGWCILPGIGRRRVAAAGFSALMMILLLNGATSMGFLIIPLAAWLFLRQRPIVSYSVLIVPVGSAYILAQAFSDYGSGALVLTISLAVLTAAAWLGRSLAVISRQGTAKSR